MRSTEPPTEPKPPDTTTDPPASDELVVDPAEICTSPTDPLESPLLNDMEPDPAEVAADPVDIDTEPELEDTLCGDWTTTSPLTPVTLEPEESAKIPPTLSVDDPLVMLIGPPMAAPDDPLPPTMETPPPDKAAPTESPASITT